MQNLERIKQHCAGRTRAGAWLRGAYFNKFLLLAQPSERNVHTCVCVCVYMWNKETIGLSLIAIFFNSNTESLDPALYSVLFQPLHGAKWPFMCWCAVKNPHTHSLFPSPFVIHIRTRTHTFLLGKLICFFFILRTKNGALKIMAYAVV